MFMEESGIDNKIVRMNKLHVEAVQQCIDYMYSSVANITFDNVENVLHASDFMQLIGLSELCFKFLKRTISSIEIYHIAMFLVKTYGGKYGETFFKDFAMDATERIIVTESFLNSNQEDLTRLLGTIPLNIENANVIKCRALFEWLKFEKHRMKLLPTLITNACISLQPRKVVIDTGVAELMNELGTFSKKENDDKSLNDAKLRKTNEVKTEFSNTSGHAPKLETQIAILNKPSGFVEIFHPKWGTYLTLCKVSKSVDVKLTSICGNLCMLKERSLFIWNGQTWKNSVHLQRKPNRWSQFLSFQDCVYIIDKFQTCWYNPKNEQLVENIDGCLLGDGFCATASDNLIYAMGGWDTGKVATRFDPLTDTWSSIAPMNMRRSWGTAVILNENVYVIGGKSSAFGKNQKSVERYDTDTNTWTKSGNISRGRSHSSSCVVGDTVYVFGGEIANESEIDDNKSDLWEPVVTCDKYHGKVSVCLYNSTNIAHNDK
uniref:ring canal kelch homolog n=1 Tax=Styela clava TaxID=7725 RepID=UPI00193A98A1|nr:ring canal kelch homolog [Styela clava]